MTFRIVPYEAAFSRPLVTGAGTVHARRGWYVFAEGPGGLEGLGEASPLPGWGSESVEACEAALKALVDRGPLPATLDALEDVLAPRTTPAAWAAAELALLDLQSREAGKPLAAMLGGARRAAVAVNALVAAIAPEAAALEARSAVEAGFPAVKLKVGAQPVEADVARVLAVRAAIGEAELRLDANGGWSREQAVEALTAFRPARPAYVEQPVAPSDAEGLVAVARESEVATAADEAVRTPEDAMALLDLGVRVLILKPMAQGGLRSAGRVAEEARRRGARVIVTSSLDRGVGTAGVLHLAAALAEADPMGLATAGLFAAGPALKGLTPVAGAIALPTGPGLGLAPLDPAIAAPCA